MSRRPAAAAAVAAVLATALLGGCDAMHQTSTRYTPGMAAPRSVTVIKGDTVYALARRHNVAVRAMIEANGLRPPYYLYAGQTVYLPDMPEHTVVAGETVSQIARANRVAMADLVRANDLQEPYVIRVGQRLKLPTAQIEPGRTEVAASPAPPRPEVRREPVPVPVPEPKPDSEPKANQRPEPPRAPPELAAAPPPAPPPIPSPEPGGVASGFVWPAKGDLIARFGPMGKGLHNDGINIAVPHGAPIRAAADGVVAYAGNELRGFGRLLLIKHDGGWMSAYAHNAEILVARGARVKRGQVVARAGATGNVRAPQLHFELRKGAAPVDPLEHLPSMNVQELSPASGRGPGPA